MTEARLPPGVAELIARHIHSVEQLEVLLLLQRRAAEAFDAETVATALATHPASAWQRLEDLEERGLLAREGDRFRFHPKTPDLARDASALADAYRDRRVTVIGLIFAKPLSPLRDFSAAFDLRKGKP